MSILAKGSIGIQMTGEQAAAGALTTASLPVMTGCARYPVPQDGWEE